MIQGNMFSWLDNAITQFLTSYGGIFLNVANGWAPRIFLWVLAYYAIIAGFQSAMGSSRGIEAMLSYCVRYVGVQALLRYYDSPIPGAGVNFHQIFTGTGAYLAGLIDLKIADQLIAKFSAIILGMQTPHWYDVFTSLIPYLHYYGCVFWITAIQFVMIGVISFGWVAQGIIVIVGSVCIVCLLLPGRFPNKFWSWLEALIQYSFYPVVANACVFIYAVIMINFLNAYPGPYTLDYVSRMVLTLAGLGMTLVFVFFKITSLVGDIFRGSSGQHTLPGIGMWRG